MLTLRFIQRKTTKTFEGDTKPVPVTDIRVYDGETVAFETSIGFRDKYEASRYWSELRPQIVANAIVVDGDEQE